MIIKLNKVCFALPMKSFFIDYTVSKKRELPVVKEFVIRVIYLLNSTKLETIQDLFGFSDKEILAIIDNLQEEHLIEWENEKLKLTYYARSKFTDDDGTLKPTFFEITDESSPVDFELYNFQMLSNEVKRACIQDFTISLKLPDDRYQNLLKKAQNAFDTKFNWFREFILKENIFSEVKELYKINHVSDRYDATLPLEVEYFIETDSPDKIKMKYVSKIVSDWDENKSFFSLMDSTIKVSSSNNQYASFNSYLNTSNDPLLIQYWNDSTNSINLKLLVNHYKKGLTKLNDDTFMLIGNFYTENNRTILSNRLKDIFKTNSKNSGMIWLTNSESKTWGKTSDLNSMINDIFSLFDKRKKSSYILLGMVCKSFQESLVLKNTFWKLSNAKLMDLPNKFGGDNSEFLIIPHIMVASLYHLQFDDYRDISYPIGYVSFEPKYISEVSKKLQEWTFMQHRFNDFFDNKNTEDEQKIRNKYFMPILQQC